MPIDLKDMTWLNPPPFAELRGERCNLDRLSQRQDRNEKRPASQRYRHK